MYYEEKIINGVLCWRDKRRPEEWTAYTIEELSIIVVELSERLDSLIKNYQ